MGRLKMTDQEIDFSLDLVCHFQVCVLQVCRFPRPVSMVVFQMTENTGPDITGPDNVGPEKGGPKRERMETERPQSFI